MTSSEDEIDKKVDACWLLSFYGGMMTKRQQELMNLYFEEDLSLSEIAQISGVSRQCVYNTLQRAEKQLSELESKLGLVAKFRQLQSMLGICRQDLNFVVATADTQKHLLKVKSDIEEMFAEEEK
jgi:predicted DNA-binding protein YlxM (UPF0122 family)